MCLNVTNLKIQGLMFKMEFEGDKQTNTDFFIYTKLFSHYDADA